MAKNEKPLDVQETPKVKSNKVYASKVQMAVGVDLLGSKMSLSAGRSTTLEVTPLGIKACSKASNRSVLIPWPNIKGVELFPEVDV